VIRAALTLCLLAAACGPEEPLSLRVMSYNVKGLDWNNGTLATYPVAAQTADLVTTVLAEAPDVIGIQEAWSETDGGSLAAELSAATGLEHSHSSTTTRGWLPYVQQNVILSRFPLLETAELDLGPDPSSVENRRFQLVRLDAPRGEICIGNVHLFTDRTLQLPALEAIAAFVAGRCPDAPLIFTGDFNLTPASEPYRYLTTSFTPHLTDPAVALGGDPQARALFSSSAASPHQRIDYIFVSDAVTPLTYRTVTSPIPDRTYPDHLPVSGTGELF